MKNIIALIVFLLAFNLGYGQTTTWDGAAWSAGSPNIGVNAIIDGNYSTFVNGGNITALSLTVTLNGALTVTDGFFVWIQDAVTVDLGGTIIVNSQGSVVQINNTANTVNGTVTVEKLTPDMNAWYEYTYWSSPVSGETINGGLFEGQADRRFLFDGSKFLDATAETGNNNAAVAGQDDIDDNRDDWALVNGADIMNPGVGYASTHDEIIFNATLGGLPKNLKYTFEGPFNNGVYNVPIYRNDSELNDTNWNLIGNPYPSAISTISFFTLNEYHGIFNPTGTIEGAIYLWSQNTPPDSNTNGNENENFAVSDYAIINSGSGNIAGGDNLLPNDYIPSGQGFFVSYSNDAGTTGGTFPVLSNTVTFNNSMRVTGNNDQFFRANNNLKTKSVANKVWLNLTSDNGVFNQILTAYVDGATNKYDGMSYDAPRNLSTGAAAILYTTIEGYSKKFAIQGKAENSLNEDEVINIGFKTTIDVPTTYKLSIAQLEGDFLNGNPIYLKDNLLNTLHDLKDSDYNFTSTVGEFNERFEIVFNEDALSLGDQTITNNDLSIIELRNGDVLFKLSGNLAMSSIQIIDLQGRILYDLKIEGNSKTYNLSNLSLAPYLAKVTLSNGATITKKAIKRL